MDDNGEAPIWRRDAAGYSCPYPIPNAKNRSEQVRNVQKQNTIGSEEGSQRPGAGGAAPGDAEVDADYKREEKWLREMRTGLMVMASVILSVTYDAGTDKGTEDTLRFRAFRSCNTFAFAQSIAVIVCLLSSTVLSTPAAVHVLRLWIVLSLTTLSLAYIFSQKHHTFTLILLLYLQFGFAPFAFRLASWAMDRIKHRRTSVCWHRLVKILIWGLLLLGVVVSVAAKVLHFEREIESGPVLAIAVVLASLLALITQTFLYS